MKILVFSSFCSTTIKVSNTILSSDLLLGLCLFLAGLVGFLSLSVFLLTSAALPLPFVFLWGEIICFFSSFLFPALEGLWFDSFFSLSFSTEIGLLVTWAIFSLITFSSSSSSMTIVSLLKTFYYHIVLTSVINYFWNFLIFLLNKKT